MKKNSSPLFQKIEKALNSDLVFQQSIETFLSGKSYNIYGPSGSGLVLYLQQLQRFSTSPFVLVTSSEAEAEQLSLELASLLKKVVYFPWWGLLSYRGVSPSALTAGKRAHILSQWAMGEQPNIIVCSYFSLLNKVPNIDRTLDQLLTFSTGQSFSSQEILEELVRMGYQRTTRVSLPGDFAMRGEVLDIYPIGEDNAIRLMFEFDELEQIRFFEADSQASLHSIKEYNLAPCYEALWTEEEITTLMQSYPKLEDFSLELEEQDFSKLSLFTGLLDGSCSLLDYLPSETRLFLSDNQQITALEEAGMGELKRLQKDAEHPEILPNIDMVFYTNDFLHSHQRMIRWSSLREVKCDFYLSWELGTNYQGNITFFKEHIASLSQDFTCYITSNTKAQQERLEYLFRDISAPVVLSPLTSGFSLNEAKLVVIHENEIFGRQKTRPSSLETTQTEMIDSFIDLSPGDYVVHINYGIGQFKGIKRMKVGGSEKDYIQILYAKEDAIFLPIEQMNLVQRYIGQNGANSENVRVKLDTLGGTSWQNKKNKTSKTVEDLADWLIGVYAKRQESQGYAFSSDNSFQVEFEASFPYNETNDQRQASEEIKRDMESVIPMDRLLCGDVGFGKTEVAMRASFKATIDGKQVAILCPTTILCEQHYLSFKKRFSRFPINIAMVSRFVSLKEQKETMLAVQEGKVDILIGTHRLLSKQIQFHNLGLMIIDEEQRFGVKHKEKLKDMKSNIDCLSLSATPIPRTLHMSLANLRDMSTLKTPPQNRLPVQTFVQEFNANTIKDAIIKECDRGGQVFYLHNRVESLEEVKLFLQDLLPQLIIDIAYGGMSSAQLEDVMHRFINGGSQILLATTIIENGIDISNANTIIIDRADRYGIAQLYQLRGRVGRSGLQGYAYLCYPSRSALSELARKRLRIISEHTELGSGFKVAMRDLEVRGGGNLLGSQQSGEIAAVGFELYIQMLNDAIKKRKKTGAIEHNDVYFDLQYSGYIPDSYISDISEKMEVYKRFSGITDAASLIKLHEELYDRFGPLPQDIQRLSLLAELRILCNQLHITSLKEQKQRIEIIFAHHHKISHETLLTFVHKNPKTLKLDPHDKYKVILILLEEKTEQKIPFLKEWLEQLLSIGESQG